MFDEIILFWRFGTNSNCVVDDGLESVESNSKDVALVAPGVINHKGFNKLSN